MMEITEFWSIIGLYMKRSNLIEKDLLKAFDNIYDVDWMRGFQKYIIMQNLCLAIFGFFNSLESQSIFYRFCCQ